jgi:CopG family nickel-responsive transcriptional regulator
MKPKIKKSKDSKTKAKTPANHKDQQIERVGISIETDLLKQFDTQIDRKGYINRSEAIRDLIRMSLSEQTLENPKSEAIAGLFLVYDHHTTGLSTKLNEMQHSHYYQVIASTHVHLDHHNCLEIIILKGKAGEIQKLADAMAAIRGVKISKVNRMGLGD